MTKKRLGKGLSALIPVMEEEGKDIQEVKITDIEANKDQPRQFFEKDSMAALADSIKEHGVVQPIIVRKDEDTYQIIAGERRWRAARMAGLKTIPVIVKDYSDTQVLQIALIENLQREDLNPIEEANAYKSLMEEHKLSQEEIAKSVGKSRSAVANSLRLLRLNKKLRELLVKGSISAGHGRALLSIEDERKQIEVAERILSEGLNVRQVEGLTKEKETPNYKKKKTAEILELEDKLRRIFGTKVNLIHGKKKGKIEIEYYGLDDLERILDLINI